jgi:hypothetical protein
MTSTYFVLSLSDELKGEVLVLAAAPARVLGYLPGDRGVILEQPLSDQAGRCLLSRYHPEGGAQLDPLSKVGCGTTMRTSAAYHDALVLIEPVDSESGGSTVSIVDTNSFELLQRFGPIRGAGVQFSPKDSRFALRHGIEVWSGDFGWTEGHLLFGDLQTLWSYDPLWEEGAPYNEIGGGNFYVEAFTEDGAIISYDGNYYQKAFSAGPWAPLVLPQGASIFSDGYEWGYTTSSQLHWRGRTYDLPEGQLWDNPEPYHDGLWLAAYTERFEEGERQLHYVIEDGREPMLLSDLPDRDGGYRLFALQDGGGIAHRTQGKIYFVDENLDLHLLADGQSVVR